MGIKCPECNYNEYIEVGNSEIVIDKNNIYTNHELICEECGYEYLAKFVFGECIRWECE